MSASEIQTLKKQLAITPKTATLLIKAGYADYRALATVSPEYVAKQFGETLRMPAKYALAYKRPLRRIVWLGTQEHPENYPKVCKDWSDKALRARGVWCTNFDQLTGEEIDDKLKEVANKKSKKTDSKERAKKLVE